MTDELLPCPFCGSSKVSIGMDTFFPPLFLVGCEECDARGGADITKEKAKESWNKRSPNYDTERLDWLQCRMTGASDSERYLPFRIYWGAGRDIRKEIDKHLDGTSSDSSTSKDR